VNSYKNKNYINVIYSERNAPIKSNYAFLLANYISEKYFNNKRGKLLDIGCGRGEQLKSFKKAGYDVYGTDILISDLVFEIIKKENTYEIDLENLKEYEFGPKFENNFDFVFSKSVINLIKNPGNLLKLAYTSLKPNGKAIIITPAWEYHYKKSFYRDPNSVSPFIRLSLKDFMEINGFKNVTVEYFYQLPLVWKYPKLKYMCKLLSLFPIPYVPIDDIPIRVDNPINKIVRFSKEVMLIGCGTK
jgi:SAM-dependent methyltransferase